MFKNQITELLKIECPIIQAPMAGGITTSDFVAEVSNCGALGTIGAGYMTPSQIREQIREIKTLTNKSFGINLFVPNDFRVNENEISKSNDLLQPFNEDLNIKQNDRIQVQNFNSLNDTFHEQIKVIIEEGVPICSFTFGIPSKEMIKELKLHNIILIGTATTVNEAIEIEKSGMDLIVVQGSEAGGHRGNFLNENEESLIGLMSLIPQVVDQVSIPVIAAGGIMDGRGLMASLCLGAKAVQMGTAFLTCIESGAHEVHKNAILNSTEDQLVLTRSFSGKWARGIENKFITEMKKHEADLPEFPVQNTITQTIRKASSVQYNKEFMSLWSGQSPRLSKNESVENLINGIMGEAKKFFEIFSGKLS
ncbi:MULTISPECIES: nitronate monooxygenase [Bacillaceae]|uniref:Probable nitronate monooxygenase n=1 Tax=Gottfriedia luciferensis TaxID=178774 RepID=A0ABX2ZP46_9BACI|nr:MULTISPECIES: nitronate monooxygenase [Bacillaceae]ODG90971.1 nitronate monooxygenase [Gottfriedia luciferensis]SFC84750.1 nitronate monooxygenase [Bacillus sp. UNCCL81]